MKRHRAPKSRDKLNLISQCCDVGWYIRSGLTTIHKFKFLLQHISRCVESREREIFCILILFLDHGKFN